MLVLGTALVALFIADVPWPLDLTKSWGEIARQLGSEKAQIATSPRFGSRATQRKSSTGSVAGLAAPCLAVAARPPIEALKKDLGGGLAQRFSLRSSSSLLCLLA
jgi:hypothetical protein